MAEVSGLVFTRSNSPNTLAVVHFQIDWPKSEQLVATGARKQLQFDQPLHLSVQEWFGRFHDLKGNRSNALGFPCLAAAAAQG